MSETLETPPQGFEGRYGTIAEPALDGETAKHPHIRNTRIRNPAENVLVRKRLRTKGRVGRCGGRRYRPATGEEVELLRFGLPAASRHRPVSGDVRECSKLIFIAARFRHGRVARPEGPADLTG